MICLEWASLTLVSSLQELVRRGYDFLRLFHTKNTLEDRHLDMLWGMACLGKHESLEVMHRVLLAAFAADCLTLCLCVVAL